jgi:hypothetical protein
VYQSPSVVKIADKYIQGSRWQGIAATDCLLELAMFVIPVWILWSLVSTKAVPSFDLPMY